MVRKTPRSLYRYIDPVRFLADSFEAMRAERPDFSVRAWARDLGLRQSAILSGVLNGHRGIPAAYVPKLARSLGLGRVERRYFEALVGISRARSTADLESWICRAQKIYDNVAVELEAIEDLRILENPVLSNLLRLVERPDFRYDLRWIQRRLETAVDARALRESFDYLLARGFLALDSAGRLCRIRQRRWARERRFNPLFAEGVGRMFPTTA